MELDPSRKAKQEQLGIAWARTKGAGTLQCATGFGKTITALLIIGSYRRSRPLARVQVVVPTNYLVEQWKGRIKSFGYSAIRVTTVQGLLAKVNRGEELPACDLLILDEIHWYGSDQFSRVFDIVPHKHVLGLTATLRDDDEKNAIIRIKCPIIAEVTLEECVRKGWVSPFTVYNLGIEMTSEEKEVYDGITKSFNKSFAAFNQDFSLAMSCLNNPRERALYASKKGISSKALLGQAGNWKRQMTARQTFLYELPRKIEHCKEILDLLPEARALVFNQGIKAADKVARELGDKVLPHHSKASKRANAIGRFIDPFDPVKTLSVAKSLDQGADFPFVDLLIILAGDSTALQGLQRYGRGIRVVEDKRCRIIEIYVKGTQDEIWLKSRQRKIPREHITNVSSVEEILGPRLREPKFSLIG